MQEFKIGQVVQITNRELAEDYYIESMLDRVFTVDKLCHNEEYAIVVSVARSSSGSYYYVPAEACTLIQDI